MKSKVTKLLYILIPIAILFAGAFFIFETGKGLQTSTLASKFTDQSSQQYEWHEILEAFRHPMAIFILQLIVIIIASQLCAYLFKKIGQPRVMGEIIAGILLGPSLIGGMLPEFSAFVFPKGSLSNIRMLSQVGLILFMFVIGMELDPALMRKKARAALLISNSSIVVPFGLGIGLSYFLNERYGMPGIPFYAFALFVGIAMSITAFPVLARIIQERELVNSKLGIMALTSAALGDVAGWCLLAVVIAIAKAGSLGTAMYTLVATLVYIGLMLGLVRPLLKMMTVVKSGRTPRSTIAIVFVVLLLSAYSTEVIGIHALFGAFMAGLIMPEYL